MVDHIDETVDVECTHSFFKDNVLTRFKQESTWRGIITVAALAGWQIYPDEAESIITAGASLVAAINILKGD